jgi:SH3-like domain-containing protein
MPAALLNQGEIVMNTRNNSRLIDADGHAAWVTREAAAHYLRLGRTLGYIWRQTEFGWKAGPAVHPQE